jgi:hypothetical protein
VEAQIVLGAELLPVPSITESPLSTGAGDEQIFSVHHTPVDRVTPWPPLAFSNEISVRLGHHTINNGVSIANLHACLMALRVVNTDVSLAVTADERQKIRAHLMAHVQDAGIAARRAAAITASLESGQKPPKEWFENPNLSGPTALTVTDDGRVYGHAACFDTGHIGFSNFVDVPREDVHVYYLLGDTVTADGTHIATGAITIGTGHASISLRDIGAVTSHYDNTGTRIADVVTGNDQYGIWVAGSVRPGATPDQIADLRAAKLSGDWREVNGSLRLVAMLAVNVPGFPVPRLSARVAEGKSLALVAAGAYKVTCPSFNKEQLAERIGRDNRTKNRIVLHNRVHGD